MNMSKTSMSQGQMNIRQATSNILQVADLARWEGWDCVCGWEEQVDNCCVSALSFSLSFFVFQFVTRFFIRTDLVAAASWLFALLP